jgi:5-methyltetrahydropteroyltriglutamate--homocysteine methyltransferase
VTATRTDTVFHSEVVGSLVRPPELLAARNRSRAGALDAAAYQAIEDQAVDDALRLQEEVGLDVATDGEMRRDIFFDFLVKGFGQTAFAMETAYTVKFHSADNADAMTVEVPFTIVAPLDPLPCPALPERDYAKSRTSLPLKITLPSPGIITNFWGKASREAYPDPLDLVRDAAEAVKRWAVELAAAGCEYIQLDAPDLCDLYCDPEVAREMFDARGIASASLREFLLEQVLAFGALETPGTMKGIHLCRGNGTQSWITEGDYGQAAAELFPRLGGFDVVHLEYDDYRSGGFEPLAKLPEAATVALGLVSTKWVELEDPQVLKSRIADAARFHPLERLALAPQCGFASGAETAEDRKITEQTQRDKLQLIVDVARETWPS